MVPKEIFCMARGITASNFWLSTYAFAMPADFEFRREKVLRLTELERQLVNSRVPKIAIYFTHVVFTRVVSSQWREHAAYARIPRWSSMNKLA